MKIDLSLDFYGQPRDFTPRQIVEAMEAAYAAVAEAMGKSGADRAKHERALEIIAQLRDAASLS